MVLDYKLLCLGKDDKIHACSVSDKKVSCCEERVPVSRVNPSFQKLPNIIWCYECDYLLEQQEDYL